MEIFEVSLASYVCIANMRNYFSIIFLLKFILYIILYKNRIFASTKYTFQRNEKFKYSSENKFVSNLPAAFFIAPANMKIFQYIFISSNFISQPSDTQSNLVHAANKSSDNLIKKIIIFHHQRYYTVTATTPTIILSAMRDVPDSFRRTQKD